MSILPVKDKDNWLIFVSPRRSRRRLPPLFSLLSRRLWATGQSPAPWRQLRRAQPIRTIMMVATVPLVTLDYKTIIEPLNMYK